MFEGLPASIRIGAFDVPITVVDKITETDDCWGEYAHGYGIKLARDHPSALCGVDTVMHEINHAIWRNAHLGASSEEERACGAMATSWLQVMRDNPALMAWVTKAVNGQEN